ncbi:MAG: hypothetical protein ACTHJ0_00390 [Flavipsychrobacter sp.]
MSVNPTATLPSQAPIKLAPQKSLILFSLLWILLFLLYLPAAGSGRVGDFPGWLYQLRSESFIDYVNRTHSGIRGLYHFTQVCTYFFYLLFGVHAWPWHLLHITLQALNSFLLFSISRRLLADAGLQHAERIAYGGTILYCISPGIAEVVVWESAYHYLQGFLFMLLILRWLQLFQHSQRRRYIWLAGVLFFLSTFTLEVFYITPFLSLALVMYYRFALGYDKNVFKKSLKFFFLPQLLLFVLYWLLLSLRYGNIDFAHVGNAAVNDPLANMAKIAKLLFHILFFGRFFSGHIREKVYAICDSKAAVLAVLLLIGILLLIILLRIRKMSPRARVASLLFVWMLMALALVTPMWFPDILLVIYDRYTYFTGGFLFILLAVLLSFIPYKAIRVSLFCLYALINLFFAHRLIKYWHQSANVVDSLVNNFPAARNKTVIMLSLPECLNGVQMIGSRDEGEYKLMHDMLLPDKIANTVYDGLSFNMLTAEDGTHVKVINDSTVDVILNQWGTWWWYGGLGGHSYETPDYKLDLKDPGHWYELTLKHPADRYLLLFEVGDQWKKVNWAQKNMDQY